MNEPFTIHIDSTEEKFSLLVEPTDNNGLTQYILTVPEDQPGPFPADFYAWIERDGGNWRQSPESVERGPNLPCFLVEEIGEQIERFAS